jgi:hypothetical protein
VKNLDDAIDWAKNENPTLRKFIHFHPHEDNSNIGLSDKDQELLDKFKLPNFIERRNQNLQLHLQIQMGPSTHYQIPSMEIPPIDIDQSQYEDFSERTQLGPSTNKPNTHSQTNTFDKFNFRSLSTINFSVSTMADSENESVVSDHFHPSSGKIVQLHREWWKINPTNDI